MKLSIITINFNEAEDLIKTFQSVKGQLFVDYEHIIIDGGSTDGSKAFIEENSKYFSYWVSESDKGIYNAMNKGIVQAKGEYLLMLNAGDVLHNNEVLGKVFDEGGYDQDIIYGDVDRQSRGVVFTESIFPDKLTFGFLRKGMISHQAVFFKRKLHDIIGMYDESLKYGADWHFIILAVCKFNVTYIHLNIKMAICSTDGLTCNPSQFTNMDEEKKRVLEKEFPAFIDDYLAIDGADRKEIRNRLNYFVWHLKKILKKKFRKN